MGILPRLSDSTSIDPHPLYDTMLERMTRGTKYAASWSGNTYRFVSIKYANRRDLLSGLGSQLHGGRWNARGSFRAVYGSLTPETAFGESMAVAKSFGVAVGAMRPAVVVELTLRLQAVLDLSLPKVLKLLKLERATLVADDWKAAQAAGTESLCQAIGRCAWQLRLEGLIVPSAVEERSQNLVYFPARRQKGSSVRITGARDLRPGT